MANYTENYNLMKPSTEYFNKAHQNGNMDIIDEVLGNHASQLADIAVYPCNFGAVGDGVADDTIPIQDALDYCKLNKRALIINKKHKISKIVIDTTYVFTIISQGGELVGMTTGEYTAMIEIVDCQFVRIIGDLAINGSFNKGYDCGILVRHGTAGSSFLNFYGMYITCLKRAFRIGTLDNPNSPMSEIMLDSIHSIGCPIFLEAIGCQAGVTVVNSMIVADTRYVNAEWLALPVCCVKSVGAIVRVSNSDVLNMFTADYPTFVVQPILSPEYNNPFGNVYVSDCTIESASALALIYNPDSANITNPSNGVVKFNNCNGYHAYDLYNFVYADAGYKGKIYVQGCNFYAPNQRSVYANVKSDDPDCNIYVDEVSFGTNFKAGLEGIVGGIVHFTPRQILRAYGTDAQAVTKDVLNTVVFKSVSYHPDLNRFASCYSTATGIFTVPNGGLENLEILATIVTSPEITSADLLVQVDGGSVAMNHIVGNGQIVAKLKNLTAGETVKIAIVPYGANGTLNTPQFDELSISASHW